MFLVVRWKFDKDKPEDKIEADFFGPFPTDKRAKEYASSFGPEDAYCIETLIVPNCVQVKLVY